jgi:uridine kinase
MWLRRRVCRSSADARVFSRPEVYVCGVHQTPIYNFKESRRVGYRTVEKPASRVVIIEGIYALSARIRPLLDLRVSIRGGVHFDLVKRVLRDINRSGQAPEEIIQQVLQRRPAFPCR